MTDALRRAEQVAGRRVAVSCGDLRLDYAGFGARCRGLAAGLCRRGVRRGDRVAVLMGNCHRYLEAYLAIPGIGAVIVPLNTRHAPAELRATLADSGARLLIVDDGHRDAVGRGVPLVTESDYEQMAAISDAGDLGADGREDDLAALFYTGGTTGAPKAAMLIQRNLVANAFAMTIAAGYRSDDAFLHTAPMFHLADASSIHALTWLGARHVFVPRFEPGAVLDLMHRERVTCTIMVPAMIGALLRHPATSASPPADLRLLLHGGAPMVLDLLRRAVSTLKCSFSQAYGLTESSSLATMLAGEEREVGEVTLAGPGVFAGYWNRPADTADALRDGRLRTGDLGHLDADGYLFLVDRAKDVVITGGENVYSTEVEDAVRAHPAVTDAAVIGLPDVVWADRVGTPAGAR